MADVRVAQGRKIDFLNRGPGDNLPVPADADIVIAFRDIQVEFLVGKCGGNVAPFRAGNAVHESDRLECLHLVAHSSRVPLDHVGNILALDRMGVLVIQGNKGD